MLYIIQSFILTFSFITLSFSDCQTYYADVDGDGDGAKSSWCSWTELSHGMGENWEDGNWETNGCGTAGWNGSGEGFLNYGPYISSGPGVVQVTWDMLVNGDTDNDGTHIAYIDINDVTTNQVVAWQDVYVNNFNASMAWQDFTLTYWSSPDHVYEFRTYYKNQGGHLVVRYITHINEDANTADAYATTELCDGDDTAGWSLNDNDLMPLCSGNSNDVCWDCSGTWAGGAADLGCGCGESAPDECGVCGGSGIADGACCDGVLEDSFEDNTGCNFGLQGGSHSDSSDINDENAPRVCCDVGEEGDNPNCSQHEGFVKLNDPGSEEACELWCMSQLDPNGGGFDLGCCQYNGGSDKCFFIPCDKDIRTFSNEDEHYFSAGFVCEEACDDEDADGDGVCDDVDDCVVDSDASQECGCNTGVADGECDCAGNTLNGDVNNDEVLNVADVVTIVSWIIEDGPPSLCPGDINNDGAINVADIVEIVAIIIAD